MGLLLSVLIGYVGVLEAIQCYKKFLNGMLPEGPRDLEWITKQYEEMFKRSLLDSDSRSDEWTKGSQGYLELSGGGKDGPLKATIKYHGQDSMPILFSTKISSFGQDSDDGYLPNNRSPRRDVSPRNELNVEESYFGNQRNRSSESPGLWDDDESSTIDKKEPEQQEKLTWRYRPLTPTTDSSLPEIHFDSYDRKSFDNDENMAKSDEFYRSLDGIKFRPLQRDDSRRRSFKKRHSSSSGSSRESKASREEELSMFTSLEESEQENSAVKLEFSSSPNLTTDYHSKMRSRSPATSLSLEQNGTRNSRSPSTERPHLKDIPKSDSFEEEEVISLKSNLPQQQSTDAVNADDEENGVNFWDQ